MASILVTGGAGFIGSHVAVHLIKAKHEVTVIDDLSGGIISNVPHGCKFSSLSVVDTNAINELFADNKFDYVFHLAAYAAEGLSHFIRKFNYNNNLIGSINIINACIKYEVKCLAFTSSIAVYGANQLPMTEDAIPKPEDPYGISKYAVELDLKAAHEMFGLNYVIFRPHNVYGEYQNIGDKYRNVIGIFMNQIMQDKRLTVFGDGEQTRAFSYIDDVAPYIANSVFEPKVYNEIFNIGADVPYSINQLIKEVGKVFNTIPKVDHLSARSEVKHAYSDHSKVKKAFSITATTSLEVGLERMAKWAIKIGICSSPKFNNIEILKKLPQSWL